MAEQTAAGPDGQAAEAPKDKKGKLLPVIIAVYVLAVLSAAALVERVLAPGMAGIPAPVHQQVVYVTGGGQTDNGGHAKKEKKKKKEGRGEGGGSAEGAGNVYLIEDLVVNPAGSGGMRYLAASIGLRSSLEGFMGSMKERDAPVKDTLIRILSSKTVEELADTSLRESMREEILGEVQRVVPEQEVDAVYFMRFVLQ